MYIISRSQSSLKVTANKCALYKAVVLNIPLYGSECWAVNCKAYQIYQLEVFHHRCIAMMHCGTVYLDIMISDGLIVNC